MYMKVLEKLLNSPPQKKKIVATLYKNYSTLKYEQRMSILYIIASA